MSAISPFLLLRRVFAVPPRTLPLDSGGAGCRSTITVRLKSSSVRFLAALVLLAGATSASALTCNSVGVGPLNWNVIASWSCGRVPTNADDVHVVNNSTVTVNIAGAVALSLTVDTGANASTLQFNAATGLTVTNNVAVNAPTGAVTKQISVGSAALTVTNGNVTVTGGSTNPSTSQITVTSGSINVNTGNLTITGGTAGNAIGQVTVTTGSLTVQGNATLTGGTSATRVALLTVSSGLITINGGLIINATVATSSTASITAAGGRITVNGAAGVTNGDTVSVGAGTFSVTNAAATFSNSNAAIVANTTVSSGQLNVTGALTNGAAETITISTTGSVTAGGTLTNNGTITLSSTGTVTATGTFANGATGTMTTGPGTVNAATFTNDNVVTVSTGLINVTGAYTNTAVGDTVTISGAGGRLTVGGTLTNVGSIIFNTAAGGIVNANGDFVSSGIVTNTTAGTLNIGGNATVSGTFTAGAGGVVFNGAAAQALGGAVAATFNNLTINKATNNLTINTTPTVNGTLTFTKGNIVTGANRVILGTVATIATPSASSYVVGSLQKNYIAGAALSYFAGNNFPVGDATNYTPVNISAGTTTTVGSLTVSTLTPDHPQVATPIASTGIDAAKSANRYWRFNNSGLTVGTAISATFTFVAGDVDASATTANFIVERYDGTNWNPTTLFAANALNTQASNITPLAAGDNDFAVGDPFSGFNGIPGAFNVFEASTAANAILGRIYTKIVGTAITLQVVAVNAGRTAVNAAYNTNPITVDLLDARDNTVVVTAASNCRSTWFPPGGPALISTQSLSPVWTSGRSATITITAPANAWRDVRVRVTQAGNIGCSTDRFSIRPTAFSSVTSTMNNNGTSGAPSLKTGQNFTISALTGLTGYDNGSGVTLANPQLIPLIDNTIGMVVGSPTAGAIGGAFGAASSGTATGATFFYSEVGNFGLIANAVYDNVFTAVDQPGDCTADFSNALVGGQYGCKFGSPAVALASGFGRFIPDNFNISYIPPPVLGTVCGAGSFTYVGQTFVYTTAPVMTVTARNGTTNGLTNAPTTNYAGAYMKITTATLTPNTIAARYSRFDALGGGTTPGLDTSNVPGAPGVASDPVIGTFTAGVGALTFGSGTGLKFTRSTTTPSARFDADIALALNVIDADAVAFAGNPASFGAATGGNGIAFSSGKDMRFGRLFVPNTYGSEKLNLTIPVEVQYYLSGTQWQRNSLDSCTTITAPNNIALGNYTGTLNLANLPASNASIGSPISLGLGRITLAKPSAAVTGSVELTINLGTTTTGSICPIGPVWTPNTTSGANLAHLKGDWCVGANYAKDPDARIDFGILRNKFIFNRENY